MAEVSKEVTTATKLKDPEDNTPTSELMLTLFDKDKEGKHLINRLREQHEFLLARDVLKKADKRGDATGEQAELVRQQYALCLYKDPDLPAKGRLDDAFDVLSGGTSLADNKDPETLGIAGAISRRYWELDGHRSHLERALGFYMRGYQLFLSDPNHKKKDKGYTGINAAFLLDQLAQLSIESMTASDVPFESEKMQREQAQQIRQEVIEGLDRLMADDASLWKDWWVVATLIEAYFGNGEFEKATKIFNQYDEKIKVCAWEIESTLKQLVALARLHGHIHIKEDIKESDPALECLKVILGDRDPKLVLVADQKLGLALSGGGFRASFYEIGVLAALAEFDLLRYIEVLSTVSGGSILGALYYLEMRHLLNKNADGAIKRSDYVDVVKRVAKKFLAGVEHNIRTRVAINPLRTVRMFFTRWDSRTIKAGDLYEKFIYQEAEGAPSGPILMRDLLIEPNGIEGFKPKAGNWERRAKVPILIINATSLNTGHNWQFTATWMGEPLVETDIDSNPRLRRMYYSELVGTAAERHAELRLGHAVAASACVPGLFEPLALTTLYEKTSGKDLGPTTVRLVDGGVHDNQGIESLLEQDCNVLIVADASGQMPYEREPSAGVVGSVLRSNSTMMARIREAQYKDVKAQREVGRRKGFAFIHLKDDLHARPVNWQGCDQRKDGSEDPRTDDIDKKTTSYGIRKTAQEKLAAIRTDLDSFSEVEAYSLMYSGYRAARKEIPETIDTLPLDKTKESDWNFLVVEDALISEEASSEEAKKIEKHLYVGSKAAFKVWHLSLFLKIMGWILLIGGGGSLLWWTFGKDWPVLSSDDIWWLVVGALVTTLAASWVMKLMRPQDLLMHILTGIGLALVGWIAACIHIFSFDLWFKKIGRLKKAKSPPTSNRQ